MVSCSQRQKWALALPTALLLLFVFPTSPVFARSALVIFPELPPDGTYVVDEAGIISEEDEAAINAEVSSLVREHQIPIVVVTIRSLAAQEADGYTIERYARDLFDTYEIGTPARNLGILLLVSTGNRRARIELGADWGHEKDAEAQRIMDRRIIPQFKRNNYSKGILAGVESLSTMARGRPFPSLSNWQLAGVGAVIVFLGALMVSLFRSGHAGWGWAVLTFVGLSIVGILAFFAISAVSAGISGGGSSGGGGASGSW